MKRNGQRLLTGPKNKTKDQPTLQPAGSELLFAPFLAVEWH